MSDELKPCKHCGGEARFQIFDTTCNVECQQCGIGTRNELLDNYQVCVYKWNRSADDNLNADVTNLKSDEISLTPDMDERGADSREKIEADLEDMVRSWCADDTSVKTTRGAIMYWRVKELLDRQAAITSAEWCWSNDALEEELTRKEAEVAELRAELETYRKYADQGKCDNCGTVESETSKVPELDTREQLEADLHQYANPGDYENTLGSFWEKKILSFLDRQAAITRRETLLENPLHNNPYVGLVRGKQWERKQASDYYCGRCGWKVTDHDSYCSECGGALHKATNKPNSKFDVLKTAENAENVTSKNEIHDFDDSREKLEDDLEKLRKQWKEYDGNFMRIYSYVAYSQIVELLDRQAAITRRECERPNWDYCETCEALAELTAERDELQAAIDAMENGQFYAIYRKACEERDHFKDLVRKQSESNH